MTNFNQVTRMLSRIIGIFLVIFSGTVFSAGFPTNYESNVSSGYLADITAYESQNDSFPLLLAESEADNPEGSNEPAPGSLVIPGEENDKSEKKCLNVCRKWGETCIINPRTNLQSCRRTCKDFGIECF